MNSKIKISRSIRGATTTEQNTKEEIEQVTIELLSNIIESNKIDKDDITSVIFTLTPDLNADFPAKYARIHLGWDDVPMICAQEIAVEDSLKMCIRVLITLNTIQEKHEIKHVYLGRAKALRPDLN
ncbi:MAG: chorismate mutase [bacterium]